MRDRHADAHPHPIRLPVSDGWLHADLVRPTHPTGLVVFLHGSGNIRQTPYKRDVARAVERRGFATLPVDLLTEDEEEVDRQLGHLRFDIARLGRRAIEVLDWIDRQPELAGLRIGLSGASTGAAAALVAAAERPTLVSAVVSMGGRPDLTGPALSRVLAPTLLLVGDPVRGGMLPLDDREPLVKALADPVVVNVPRVGHLVHWEDTEATLRLMHAFLATV